MALPHISGLSELKDTLSNSKKTYLLLYKPELEQSECARKNLEEASSSIKEASIRAANVSQVRDIHPEYGISSVPSLLEFTGKEFVNVIKGCQKPDFYKARIEEGVFTVSDSGGNGKTAKSVTVYTTPTCAFCTQLKMHLRRHNVPFREIDVSRDSNAAQRLMERSGQQGVPQTDINGEIIVGFDKQRINSLLNLGG